MILELLWAQKYILQFQRQETHKTCPFISRVGAHLSPRPKTDRRLTKEERYERYFHEAAPGGRSTFRTPDKKMEP